MLALLLYLGLPTALAFALWRAEAGALSRKRARLANNPSKVELKVRVQAEPGTRVSLGSSVETPESISGTPLLTAADVVLLEEPFDERDGTPPKHAHPGRRLRVRPGTQLRIESLAGARRHELEIETTASGVRHHYSFEVSPEIVFWISAALVRPDARGPFREDVTWELAPLTVESAKDRYVASAARGALPRTLETSSLGLGPALVFTGFVFALSFIPYAGPYVWGIATLLMAFMVLGEWSAAREPVTTADANEPAPPPALRVDTSPSMTADAAGTEDEADGGGVAEQDAPTTADRSQRR